MIYRVCDAEGCKSAFVDGNEYSSKMPIGWVCVEYSAEVRPEKSKPMPDPEVVEGEVEVDGKTLPIRIFKPKEVSAYEDEAPYEPKPYLEKRHAYLCTACAPFMRKLRETER